MIKSEMKYDVTIIGAGPAGSVLAYVLAREGLRVALVDKEKFPRKKVCAGGLPARVLEVLPFDATPVIERDIFEVTLTHRLQGRFARAYDKPLIYMVDRERFDYFLALKAKEAGADFMEGQRISSVSFNNGVWTAEATDAILQSRVLVGADGAKGIVAKELGLKASDSFHNGLQIEVPFRFFGDASFLQRGIALDWGRFEDSYGWLFPRREMVSIGVQGPLKMGKQLRTYLEDLSRCYGISPEHYSLAGHLIPHRVHGGPIATEAALLIGDAAGLVDFWTGEGIYYAISSARIAADWIAAFVGGRTKSLKGYESEVNQSIALEIKTSYQFSRLFNHVSLLAFKMIRKYDYPWDVFCRAMRGDRTFLEIKQRARPDILFSKLLFKSRRRSRGR